MGYGEWRSGKPRVTVDEKRFRDFLRRAGYTFERLSDETGVSERTYRRACKDGKISLDAAVAVCQRFKRPIDYVFGYGQHYKPIGEYTRRINECVSGEFS